MELYSDRKARWAHLNVNCARENAQHGWAIEFIDGSREMDSVEALQSNAVLMPYYL